jgi:hypothetical protein
MENNGWTWYRRASINPWSIFLKTEYNRELKKYHKTTVCRDKLAKFISDITNGEAYLVNAYTYSFEPVDLAINIGANLPDSTDYSDVRDSLIASSHKITSSLATLDDQIIEGVFGRKIYEGEPPTGYFELRFQFPIVLV